MYDPDCESVEGSPIIGILTSIYIKENNPFIGLERTYVNNDYISAIEAVGGVPLLVPIAGKDATVKRQIESVDALLCTGGYDPNPLLYGENPSRRIEFIFPEVDEHQIKTVHFAVDMGKPILGICRGLQILNIAFGGSLYQDLSLAPNSYIQHVQKSRKHSAGHQVTLVENTMLAEVFSEKEIVTNSFHHLAVKEIAPGFIANAYAADGIIEGIERSDRSPVMAVQWHPEMMYEKYPAMLAIFRRFVESAKKARSAHS